MSTDTVNWKVVKRNNELDDFKLANIEKAILGAAEDIGVCVEPEELQGILDDALEEIRESLSNDAIGVEDIQDIVENTLADHNYLDVAKQFVRYRYEHKRIREFVEAKEQFIEAYKKSSNTANATVDDNSNVGAKNIAVANNEIHKTDNIQVSRGVIMRKIKEIRPDFNPKQYIKDLKSHRMYKHDESSFCGIQPPYCVSPTMYPFLNKGIKGLNGLSAAPKNIDSFCGIYINLIFAISSQFAGACLYKDQKLLIRENGVIKTTTIKDLVLKYDLKYQIHNHQGDWEVATISDGSLEVWENGKFVNINKLYRRIYNDDIYKVTTYGGKTLYTSKDHIFKVRFKDRDFEVKASDLKINDTVYRTDVCDIPIDKGSRDYQDGQVYGLIAGDGHIYKDGVRIAVNYKETFIAEFLQDYFSKYYDKQTYLRNGHKCYDFQINSREYADFLTKNIFDGIDTYTKSLKDNVYENASLDFLLGFLDGILASDGGFRNQVHTLSLTNEKLVNQVRQIISDLNIKVSQIKRSEKSGSFENARPAYEFCASKNINKYLNLTNTRRKDNKEYNKQVAKSTNYYGSWAFKHSTGQDKSYGIGSYSKILVKNLDAIKSIEKITNDDEYVYELETSTHWYSASDILTHNCATPEFLLYFDYFARKEWGDDYYKNLNVVTRWSKQGNKTIRMQIHQYFQQVIYSINQPTAARGMQSAFVNFSYFDKAFFDGMFGNFYFPDGTAPQWESLSWLQKEFMQWFNSERLKNVLTFPVESFAMVYKDGKFVDQDSADFVAEEYARGHSFFTYISDTVDSLSSCCRLKNKVQTKEFNFTNGNIGVETGSKSVITLNLNRITQEYFGLDGLASREDAITMWKEDNGDLAKGFMSYLTSILERVYIYHEAYNEILWDEYNSGLLPAYSNGFIDLNKQYLTIGINGLNEAAEYLGIECSDNPQYEHFCQLIFSTIKENNLKHKTKKLNFNTECVPAESLAIKNYNWDKTDGYWVPENRNLYASYIYIPSDAKRDIFEKIRMHGSRFIGDYLDGGSAAHLNLDAHLSKDQYAHILEYAAQEGCQYLTFNIPMSECRECGHIVNAPVHNCPVCNSDKITRYTRIIGYLTAVPNWSEGRQIEEKTRVYEKVK